MEVSSSGISFSGLFSGLDTETIIEQLLQIERRPIRLLEQKKTKLDFEKQNLQEVNNSLLTLKGTLSTLAAGVTTQMTAASSDESILTASANAAAVPGTYDVVVKQLATKHITGSNWKASGWTYAVDYGAGPDPVNIKMQNLPVGALTFDRDSGGTPINIDGTYDLTTIAQKINALWDDTQTYQFSDYAKAYVVTSELGSDGLAGTADDNEEALIIESLDTGETYSFDTADAAFLALFKENDRLVQNANIEIAGMDIYSSSNQISTAIPGVTFDLQKADPATTVTVTVGVDDDAIVDAVKEFIDKFNATTDLLADYITEDTVSDPETVEELVAGVLRSDFDLVNLKSDIRTRTTGYYWASGTTYKILADLGIESEPTSGNVVSDNIQLDEETLRVALSEDRDAVSDLLKEWSDDLDEYLEAQTKESLVKEYAGTVYARILGIDDRMDAIDDDIELWEERVDAEEARLRASFTLMEQMLAQLQTQSTYISMQLQNIMNTGSQDNN